MFSPTRNQKLGLLCILGAIVGIVIITIVTSGTPYSVLTSFLLGMLNGFVWSMFYLNYKN